MKKHLTPCDTSSEKLACLTYKTNKFKHADTPLRTASDTWSKIAVEIFFLHPPGFQAVGASYCTPPRTLHHPQHGRTASRARPASGVQRSLRWRWRSGPTPGWLPHTGPPSAAGSTAAPDTFPGNETGLWQKHLVVRGGFAPTAAVTGA